MNTTTATTPAAETTTNYDYLSRINNPEKYPDLETAIVEGQYIQTWNAGKYLYAAIGSLKGRRDKSCGYFTRGEQSRSAWVQQQYNIIMGNKEWKERRRVEGKEKRAAAAASVEIGTIFYTSWGYDQTNVDFYQVIETKGQKIICRRLCNVLSEDDGCGPMSGKVIAGSEFLDQDEYRVGLTQGGGYSIDGHYASVWDGQPKYCSWYA